MYTYLQKNLNFVNYFVLYMDNLIKLKLYWSTLVKSSLISSTANSSFQSGVRVYQTLIRVWTSSLNILAPSSFNFIVEPRLSFAVFSCLRLITPLLIALWIPTSLLGSSRLNGGLNVYLYFCNWLFHKVDFRIVVLINFCKIYKSMKEAWCEGRS